MTDTIVFSEGLFLFQARVRVKGDRSLWENIEPMIVVAKQGDISLVPDIIKSQADKNMLPYFWSDVVEIRANYPTYIQGYYFNGGSAP